MSARTLQAHVDDVLAQWSSAVVPLISRVGERTELQDAVLRAGTVKLPVEEQACIADLSRRVGVELPASYLAFLSVSGGAIHPGIDGLMLPASQVDTLYRRFSMQHSIIAQGGEEYLCVPHLEVGSHSVRGILSRDEVLRAICVSEVQSGQFVGLLAGAAEDGVHPTCFVFDFWGTPRLYLYFIDLLRDEVQQSVAALSA